MPQNREKCKRERENKPHRRADRAVRPYKEFHRAGCPHPAAPGLYRTTRQGTRALPYKVLRYRDWADRVVRPYNRFRRGGVLLPTVVPTD